MREHSRGGDLSNLQETHHHPGGTGDESLSATNLLHNVQGGDRANNVDRAENDLGDVAVAKTGRLENGRSVVEEVVGTRKLLASLKSHTQEGSVQHPRSGKDLIPLRLAAILLLVQLDSDLGDLVVDATMLGINTSQSCDGVARFVFPAHAVGVSRALGENKNTNTENEGPKKTKTVGDTPRGGRGHFRSTEVNHVTRPDTKGDQELVQRNEETAKNGRAAFGLVHGNQDGESADRATSD